jgi:hypothetical protein
MWVVLLVPAGVLMFFLTNQLSWLVGFHPTVIVGWLCSWPVRPPRAVSLALWTARTRRRSSHHTRNNQCLRCRSRPRVSPDYRRRSFPSTASRHASIERPCSRIVWDGRRNLHPCARLGQRGRGIARLPMAGRAMAGVVSSAVARVLEGERTVMLGIRLLAVVFQLPLECRAEPASFPASSGRPASGRLAKRSSLS